jgi:hypothetical protein
VRSVTCLAMTRSRDQPAASTSESDAWTCACCGASNAADRAACDVCLNAPRAAKRADGPLFVWAIVLKHRERAAVQHAIAPAQSESATAASSQLAVHRCCCECLCCVVLNAALHVV